MTFIKVLANLFSALFHPLWMPTLGFMLYIVGNPWLFGNYQPEHKIFEIVRILILTAVLPGFTILLLYALKFISNTDKINRDERILPYVSSGFFYIVATVFFIKTNDHSFLQAIMLGATIAIFTGLIINTLFLKISMHASGTGGLVAMVMILMPIASQDMTCAFYGALLIAGIVGSSRLAIHAHTGKEVLSGYFLGFVSQLMAYMIITIFAA
ncbi:MAG: hypothetical protein ACI959_001243 [Limisphaerales bacterium]|jgi:hypothetical protein